MSGWGWFFNIGIRVVDLGLFAAWLVWWFAQKLDDGGEPFGDEGGDGPGNDRLPPDVPTVPGGRRRDHTSAPRRLTSRTRSGAVDACDPSSSPARVPTRR